MAQRETDKNLTISRFVTYSCFFEFISCFWMGQAMVRISWTPKIAREIQGFIFPSWTMIIGFVQWKASLTIHQWMKLHGTRNYMNVHVVILDQYCRFLLCWKCHALVNVFFGNALAIAKHTSRAWSGTEFQSKIDSISWTLHSMVRNREFN